MNQAVTVRSLQQRITEMQPLRMGDEVLATPPQLRPLLPLGGLRKGAATTVQGSQHLALSLLTQASRDGAWCGAIGLPNLGIEAAEQLGLSLERFVLVPNPGRHALVVAGMLSEVVTALVLHPTEQPGPNEIERLGARLREHGTALVVLGGWPRGDTSLRVVGSRWLGLGRGHGLLDTNELLVQSSDRRGQRRHTVQFREGRLIAVTPRARQAVAL